MVNKFLSNDKQQGKKKTKDPSLLFWSKPRLALWKWLKCLQKLVPRACLWQLSSWALGKQCFLPASAHILTHARSWCSHVRGSPAPGKPHPHLSHYGSDLRPHLSILRGRKSSQEILKIASFLWSWRLISCGQPCQAFPNQSNKFQSPDPRWETQGGRKSELDSLPHFSLEDSEANTLL